MNRRARRNAVVHCCIEPVERRMLMAAVPVTVDAATRLSGSRILGDWNTDGVLDLWSAPSAGTATVAGGAVTITAPTGSTATSFDLRNIVTGPDLDFGYNDYLQLRIKVPTGFNRDLKFSFGTTVNGAFSTAREFEIASSAIIADGQFHTYRADVGLVVYWRDDLRDLRIQPFGGTATAGEEVSIDYIEVGDIPGDVLSFNTNINYAPGVTAATMLKLESKHFAVLWDPAVNPDGIAFNTATHGLRTLRMLEESWQVYTKVLGFKEPSQNVNTGTGTRYKLNLSTWYSGYWAGVYGNFAHMNVGTGGLQDEGPGNPVPHELGHAFDMAQGGSLAGGHWESHANYMRNSRNEWFAAPLGVTSENIFDANLELRTLANSNFQQDDPRLIYADFRIYMALQDYGGAFGLDPNIAAQLWKVAPKDRTVYDKLAQIMPAGTSMKDLVGYVMRYWPMLDMANKTSLRARLWTAGTNDRAEYEYRTGSMLVPSPDKTNWYSVPLERAPEKFGYMYHELTPTAGSTSVTVEFRGMDVLGSGEDWRWSLAAVGPGDTVRYSNVFAPGTQTFSLLAGETRVMLIAIATPSSSAIDLDSKSNTRPFDKDELRLRYPYEVRVEGATPLTKQIALPNGATMLTHPNGGGKYASTATVAATAYLGVNARVLGTARVEANARVEDYAVIAGNARVRGNARVSGYSVVYGNAVVEGNAKVRDHAQVIDNAQVYGDAVVGDYARVTEGTKVFGNAIVRGVAMPFGSTSNDSLAYNDASISGTAIADYDYSMYFTLTDGVAQDHVAYGDFYYDNYYSSSTKPRGLIASYRTEELTGELLWDEFSSMHAIVRGSPTRPDDSAIGSRVLALNGVDQYALLDRSLADQTNASYGLWVNPSSADANETLLYFGGSTGNFMKLVGRNADGFAQLTMSVNGVVQTLTSTTAVPLNSWSHVAVTFGTSGVVLYINGVASATSVAMTLRPMNVLGANDFKTAEPMYLGRDAAGNFFTGKLEDVRFYNVTMTAAEVKAEVGRAGAIIGRLFTTSDADV